jgi:hypothetical protein
MLNIMMINNLLKLKIMIKKNFRVFQVQRTIDLLFYLN